MEYKKIIKEALLKQTKRTYEYGCVMVYVDVDKNEWKELQNIVDEDDIYFGEDESEGFGREMEPHITILFGIHADVPDEDVEALIKTITKPKIKLYGVSSFKNKVFDVLKIDVKSKALHVLNTLFKTLPHTSSFPVYHPHATIAYLKKDKVDEYVNKMKNIKSINAIPSKIVYSKPDGSKKEYKL
jgi:2'-5' RNA ligase